VAETTVEAEIMANPQTGDLVPGTGGLRKVRLGQRARGRVSTSILIDGKKAPGNQFFRGKGLFLPQET
jgi:hypothetical protein